MPPVPVWRYPHWLGPDEDDDALEPAPPADNSFCCHPTDDLPTRALIVARALSAGIKGANPKQLAASVLEGLRHEDI